MGVTDGKRWIHLLLVTFPSFVPVVLRSCARLCRLMTRCSSQSCATVGLKSSKIPVRPGSQLSIPSFHMNILRITPIQGVKFTFLGD